MRSDMYCAGKGQLLLAFTLFPLSHSCEDTTSRTHLDDISEVYLICEVRRSFCSASGRKTSLGWISDCEHGFQAACSTIRTCKCSFAALFVSEAV